MRPRFTLAALVLRLGVLVSAAFLIAGLVLHGLQPGAAERISPGNLPQAVAGSLNLDPGSLIHLGLLVLLLTPILRIVAVAIDFIRMREKAFVLLCIGVLFLLSVSVAIGLR